VQGRPRIEVIDWATARMHASKTPAQKVEMVSAAHRTARMLISAGVRHRHPDWTELQIAREVARRLSNGTV